MGFRPLDADEDTAARRSYPLKTVPIARTRDTW